MSTRQLILAFLGFTGLLTSCGGTDTPEEEQDLVSSEFPNMNLSKLYVCQKVIDQDNSLYQTLSLSTNLKIVYSIFTSQTSAEQKVVRLELDSYYTESGSSFSSDQFDASRKEYMIDSAGTAAISMVMDFVAPSSGTNTLGIWSFSINDGTASGTYTDADLSSQTASISFEESECTGNL